MTIFNYSTTRNLTRDVPSCFDSTMDGVPIFWKITDSEHKIAEGGLRLQGLYKENDDTKPLITVVTVVFNGGDSLEETIKNVTEQNYDNVEYIVVDGGSTDNTLDIIRKYENVINYWVSEPDKGIYDAMNKGWNLSNLNSHILFIGSGDKIFDLPSRSEVAAHKSHVIFGDVTIGDRLFTSSINYRFNLGNTIHHQALLVPKKLQPAQPFDLNFKIYADYDLNQRLVTSGATFYKSKSFLGYAQPDGVSAKLDYVEVAQVVRKNKGLLFSIFSFIYGFYQFRKTN